MSNTISRGIFPLIQCFRNSKATVMNPIARTVSDVAEKNFGKTGDAPPGPKPDSVHILASKTPRHVGVKKFISLKEAVSTLTSNCKKCDKKPVDSHPLVPDSSSEK